MSQALGPDWPTWTGPVDRASLHILGTVGSGAAGTVYEVDAWPPCYYKAYSDPSRFARRLTQLIAWRRALHPGLREFLDQSCAWPLVPVQDGDATVGFLMLRAPDDFWADMLGEIHTLELQHLIHADNAEDLGLRLPTPRQRLELLKSFAEILDFFDDQHVIYGDVSEKNILWTLRGWPRVFLIDCDNAQLGLDGIEADGVAKPKNSSWRDPTMPPDGSPTLHSDRYTLAVFCYRVFYGVKAALSADQEYAPIPPAVPGLPDLAPLLGRGLGAPLQRPSAFEWIRAASQQPPPADAAPMEPRRSRRGLTLSAIGAGLLGVLAVILGTGLLAARPPMSLAGYLAEWKAGPVKITVPHYEVGAEEVYSTSKQASGLVLTRVSIRNLTSKRLDLTAAPADLVLLLNAGFASTPGLPVEARPVAGVPSSLHLYSVGFKAWTWSVPDAAGKSHNAGWAASPLAPNQTFTSSNTATDSAIFLTPPPAAEKSQANFTYVSPTALHVLGLAWLGPHGEVLGYCPVSAWQGRNIAANFFGSS